MLNNDLFWLIIEMKQAEIISWNYYCTMQYGEHV